jgi:hypothetical protein
MSVRILGLLIAAVICQPAVASAKAKHLSADAIIDANQSWQKVAIGLRGRGVLHFKADGKWVFNPSQPAVDGDGAGNLSTAGRTRYSFSGEQGREGQLIGKIGDGAPFVAGAHGVHKIKRGERGPLYLVINDDIQQSAGAGLTDNSGHLTVHVEFDQRIFARRRLRLPCRFLCF